MRDEAIVEALKRTSLPQCSPACRNRCLWWGMLSACQPAARPAMRSVVVTFGPRRAHPNHRTCAFLVRRPGRTPSPQDLQLEAPPQYALAGNPVSHLPSSTFACFPFCCWMHRSPSTSLSAFPSMEYPRFPGKTTWYSIGACWPISTPSRRSDVFIAPMPTDCWPSLRKSHLPLLATLALVIALAFAWHRTRSWLVPFLAAWLVLTLGPPLALSPRVTIDRKST